MFDLIFNSLLFKYVTSEFMNFFHFIIYFKLWNKLKLNFGYEILKLIIVELKLAQSYQQPVDFFLNFKLVLNKKN